MKASIFSIVSIFSSLTIVCDAGVYAQYHFNCGEVMYTCGDNIADENVCPILGSDPKEIVQGTKDTCLALIEIARLPLSGIYRTKCPDGSTVISYNKYDDEGMDGRKCDATDGCLGCWDPRVIEKGGLVAQDTNFTEDSVSEEIDRKPMVDDTDEDTSDDGTASDYPSDFTMGTYPPDLEKNEASPSLLLNRSDVLVSNIETGSEDVSSLNVGFRMNKLQELEFVTFDKTIYNFTGQCDLTLASIPMYGDYGITFDLQARTTIDPKHGTTKVSSVVLKVGQNIFELQDSGIVMFNQKIAKVFPIVMNYNYTIFQELESFRNEKNKTEGMNSMTYKVYLDSGDVIKFVFFSGTIQVEIFAETLIGEIASYENKGGMLGVPGIDGLTGRKGTELTPEGMGTEWQVRTQRRSKVLFRDIQDPQFPKLCIIPDLGKDIPVVKLTQKVGDKYKNKAKKEQGKKNGLRNL